VLPNGCGLKNTFGQTHVSLKRFRVSLLCNGIICLISFFSSARCTTEFNLKKK